MVKFIKGSNSNQYIIIGIQDNGRRVYYNAQEDYFTTDANDATVYDEKIIALDDWNMITNNGKKLPSGLKRVFIPVYDKILSSTANESSSGPVKMLLWFTDGTRKHIKGQLSDVDNIIKKYGNIDQIDAYIPYYNSESGMTDRDGELVWKTVYPVRGGRYESSNKRYTKVIKGSNEIDSFKRSLEEEIWCPINNIEEIDNRLVDGDQIRLIKVDTDCGIIYFVVTGFYWDIEYESMDYDRIFEQFAILTDGVD